MDFDCSLQSFDSVDWETGMGGRKVVWSFKNLRHLFSKVLILNIWRKVIETTGNPVSRVKMSVHVCGMCSLLFSSFLVTFSHCEWFCRADIVKVH